MDEKRNSMKLDIEAVRLSDGENQQSKEFYKPIPEYPGKCSIHGMAQFRQFFINQ